MDRYVALLRGINVGGAKQIGMADLRGLFASLGFANVHTVLQSGNVVFDAETRPDPAAIRSAITAATGVDAGIVLLDSGRFREVVAANPLLDVVTDPSRALVTFVDSPVDDTASRRPSDADLLPERIVFGGLAIYQWCPDGISKSKLPAKFFAGLGAVATGRNLRTVEKLLALLDAP